MLGFGAFSFKMTLEIFMALPPLGVSSARGYPSKGVAMSMGTRLSREILDMVVASESAGEYSQPAPMETHRVTFLFFGEPTLLSILIDAAPTFSLEALEARVAADATGEP